MKRHSGRRVSGMQSVQAPSGRLARRGRQGAGPTVLHLAVTRSAAVRLAPIAAALPGEQTFVDPSGRIVSWPQAAPPAVTPLPLPSAGDFARAVIVALETVRPRVALIAGDGAAAMAAALAAVRSGVPVARLGAGLRTGDRTSAREINRIAIDGLAARLYTDSELADEQLEAEGVGPFRVQRTGSTLPEVVARWRGPAAELAVWTDAGLTAHAYVLVSLTRPETFARPERLTASLIELAGRHPVVLCLDEHARAALQRQDRLTALADAGVIVAGPLEYVEFLSLQAGAGAVLTDSASVQEETSVLGVDCYTLARTSECSLTLTHGTNVLLGEDPTEVAHVRVRHLEADEDPQPLAVWDEEAGRRIATDLLAPDWVDD